MPLIQLFSLVLYKASAVTNHRNSYAFPICSRSRRSNAARMLNTDFQNILTRKMA